MTIVYLRAVARELAHHGFPVHSIAELAAVSIEPIARLLEFGSLPDEVTVERLRDFFLAMRKSGWQPPPPPRPSTGRFAGERVQPPVTLAGVSILAEARP